MNIRPLVFLICASGCAIADFQSDSALAATVLVEAESFANDGGWSLDTQSMDVIGSPYLLAHGLGVPVADASTKVMFSKAGKYRVFVRTKNWVAHWKAPGAPGRFRVLIDGCPLEPTFGVEGADWFWQDGGLIAIPAGEVLLALQDMTGFDGRCDAILFTTDLSLAPPNNVAEQHDFRGKALGLPEQPENVGQYDLVVVGGGMAGCCTAVSAARLGLKVALIHDRPVLGGNNSSEVRVGLSGRIHQQPFPRLGDLVEEIGPIGYHDYHEALAHPDCPRSREVLEAVKRDPRKIIHNAGPASNYEDQKKLHVVRNEKNISLFLNVHAIRVEKNGPQIQAVVARHTRNAHEMRFAGRWFADCTGDGALGWLAGADFRIGRESRVQTGELLAPEKPDAMIMGASVQWYSELDERPSTFPECPWALKFNAQSFCNTDQGEWDWEAGIGKDQIGEIEQIRDLGLRAVYGNWAYLKNRSPVKEKYANRRLAWVAYVAGKRESRRLLGDVILQQQDIVDAKPYADACVTTTWTIDLHYPNPVNSQQFPGQEFRSIAKHKAIRPYAFSYRCLYSRNVPNLFMAGRNISVTHVALGTVRVMRTCGMMGEVVGMAAALCKKHDTTPRGIYENHLDELKQLIRVKK